MPIRLRGTGRMETLTEMLGPWLPRDFADLAGGFQLNARAEVASSSSRLTNASLVLTEPSIHYASRHFSQSKLEVDFVGSYQWPSNDLEAKDLTVSGNSFSMRVAGTSTAQEVDLDIQWRALLDRLQGSVRQPVATSISDSPFRQVGFRPEVSGAGGGWTMSGDCEGSIRIKRKQGSGHLDLDLDAKGRELAVLQPLQASAQYQLVGPVPSNGRAGAGSVTNSNPQQGQVVWSEPNLKMVGSLRYDGAASAITTDAMQVAGDWFATTLKGRIDRGPEGDRVLLEGPARLKMHEVASRLTTLLGMTIRAEGIQETPLVIRGSRAKDGTSKLSVRGNLGWESAEVAGVSFGPASVPLRLNETSVEVPPSRIPVGQGFVNLAGQVHYRPGPAWVQLDRGVVAESIRVTPEMTGRWLKYVAPLAAEATQIDGTLGAEIDDAVIIFDQPEHSRVVGRLNIGGVQLNAGPLADQVLYGVNQLKSLGSGLKSLPAATPGKALIRMPAQTVDFEVNHGVVSHERLFFEIDRAQVVTSGRVAFDGRLNMIAMVPLDARWLGGDLKGLAGQTVTLPIDGTLSRPSLDSTGVGQVVTQLGAQAVQSTAENYLQQQLNRGLEKLFGR